MHIDAYLDKEKLKYVEEILQHTFPNAVELTCLNNELTLFVRKVDLLNVLRFVKDDKRLMFKMLMDVTAVDLFDEDTDYRYRVVYHLLSMHQNIRLRIKVKAAEEQAVPTACDLFLSANWFEREVYDMFGIHFDGHPDLRRILTDYTFVGHPLRKDFPLNGYVEAYYDEKDGRVAYKPVDLPQELRQFDKVSSWKGVGDNKHLSKNPNLFDEEAFTS